MQKILVISMKNGIKHKIGTSKSVNEISNELKACDSEFYHVIDTCAVRVEEVSSVEQFEYDPKEAQDEDN